MMGREHNIIAIFIAINLSIRIWKTFPSLIYAVLFILTLQYPFSFCHAYTFSFKPGLSIEETYSDNINIARQGLEKNDLITEVKPHFVGELKSRRMTASLDYIMQNIFYASNSEENTIFNQYFAHVTNEILNKKFFIDIDSALVQRNVDDEGASPIYNYTLTNNRTNQLTANISPYWHQRFGSSAEGLLRYEHGIVNFDDDKVQNITSDSRHNALFLSLNSIPQDRPFQWTIGHDSQNISFKNNEFDNLKLRRTGTNVSFRVLPGFRLLGFAGYEHNDFGNRITKIDSSGAFWAIGFRFQPNNRDLIEFRFGDRFFGKNYYLKWNQRSRYIEIEVNYEEEIGNETKFLIEETKTFSRSFYQEPFSLSLTSDVFLRRRVSASAIFKKSKTSLQITPFYEKREFFNQGDTNRVISGVDTTYQWDITSRSTFILRFVLERKTSQSIPDADYFTHTILKSKYKISPNTTGFLQYSYTRFDSNNNNLIEYIENAVNLGLIWSF